MKPGQKSMEFLGNQRECLDFLDLEDLKCFKFQAENFSFSGMANDSVFSE